MRLYLGLIIALVIIAGAGLSADKHSIRRVAESDDSSMVSNRVHRIGNVWMNIANRGYFGNQAPGNRMSMEDPEHPGTWAPQCEFPAGSGAQYLFQGALWLGALIRAEGYEYPRVSVAADGWVSGIKEFTATSDTGIVERSCIEGAQDYLGREIYSPEAVAPQEFLAEFADTLSDPDSVGRDPLDGEHRPLGIKISQKSMVWSDQDISDFIIVEWEIENVTGEYLKNLYIGMYVDGDVGDVEEHERYIDDLCGLDAWRYFEDNNGDMDSVAIDLAYIADNDGRLGDVGEGNDFTAQGVSGVMLLNSPNPSPRTSFNWWISNGNSDLDFGPSWQDDGAPDDWTNQFGTPMGDVRKYFLMSNREHDYDMVFSDDLDYIESHPQVFYDQYGEIIESHNWSIPAENDGPPVDYLCDLANGFDARYLISWGPLGIFDHVDDAGNRIYRLNPGEKFTVTIAYVCGEDFHDRDNPQPDNENIDPNRFDFTDLRFNAGMAQYAFDRYLLSVHDAPAASLPQTLMLTSAFPNPFNSFTFVKFSASLPGIARATLTDLSGREVRVWTEMVSQPGSGCILVDGAGLANGLYWLRFEQNGFMAATSLVLIK